MDNIKEYISQMPKGELHVHLNGLIPTATIKEIIEQENVQIPPAFDLDIDLNRTSPSSSLQEYLKPWEILRLIPKSRKNLKLMVKAAFMSLKQENVKFVEIRTTLIYIALLNDITVDLAMTWLLDAIEECSEKTLIKAGLIITVPRGNYSLTHLETIINAYRKLGKPDRVIGLDLAGDEEIPIPKDLPSQFVRAKMEYGLSITIHAGETGEVKNVYLAINDFKADRIGHGTAAAKSIELMHLIREADVCIEVCPISNKLTNAIPFEQAHPVHDFIKNEVPFVICSDNPGIQKTSITDDYIDFFTETGDFGYLKRLFDIQKHYSFLNQ